MGELFHVRPYRPSDARQLAALYKRTRSPYRREDAAEVAAMRHRAVRARENRLFWSSLPTDERHVTEEEHRAFWVAVSTASDPPKIIGTVGLRKVGDSLTAGADTAESSGLPSAERWVRAGDVGEVRRLRVAPDWRRCGVATALMRALTAWSIEHGLRGLVLNTTAAQLPALALYQGLGFREVGRSYLGDYELVWMHRSVADPSSRLP